MSINSHTSVEDEYQRGVDCYWSAQIPTGWESSAWDAEALVKAARSPFIMGWYQSSLADNGLI
jgi:hypothetical protein